jgi:hypothetical protein
MAVFKTGSPASLAMRVVNVASTDRPIANVSSV